jgi:hypothetical protein
MLHFRLIGACIGKINLIVFEFLLMGVFIVGIIKHGNNTADTTYDLIKLSVSSMNSIVDSTVI